MESLSGEPTQPLTGAPPQIERLQSPNLKRAFPNSDRILAIACAAAYLGVQATLIRLRIPNVFFVYGASLVSLVCSLGLAVALARSLKGTLVQALWMIATSIAILPAVIVPLLPVFDTPPSRPVIAILNAYFLTMRLIPGLRGLILIGFAAGVGVGISRLIREMKILLPAAVVLAIVDMYVVFGGGLVQQANSGHAPAAATAMRSLTVALTPGAAGGVRLPAPPTVGLADFLFTALFFACFARFGMPARRTFLLLCTILCLYMAAVLAYGLDLPALVPIAFVVIAANRHAFRYTRDEVIALVVAGAIVAAAVGILVWRSRH